MAATEVSCELLLNDLWRLSHYSRIFWRNFFTVISIGLHVIKFALPQCLYSMLLSFIALDFSLTGFLQCLTWIVCSLGMFQSKSLLESTSNSWGLVTRMLWLLTQCLECPARRDSIILVAADFLPASQNFFFKDHIRTLSSDFTCYSLTIVDPVVALLRYLRWLCRCWSVGW